MEIAKSGQAVMLRLDHDEDILGSVRSFIQNEISTLVIVAGLGMIYDFELGYFDRGNYLKKHFADPHELLSMQGSVSNEGDSRIHIHASVADTKHNAFGGHLLSGRVWMSNEIAMVRLDGVRSRREIDSQKNVGILHFIG